MYSTLAIHRGTDRRDRAAALGALPLLLLPDLFPGKCEPSCPAHPMRGVIAHRSLQGGKGGVAETLRIECFWGGEKKSPPGFGGLESCL